ncbi:MAG: roadblock/LC7 domain-containing protein [Pseudomonadota bacterium]
MDKMQSMEQLLRSLESDDATIRGSALVSSDGIRLLSTLPAPVDRQLLGVVAATILSFAGRLGAEFGQCEAEYALIGCCQGRSLFLPAGREGVLAVVLAREGDWQAVLARARREAAEVAVLLG